MQYVPSDPSESVVFVFRDHSEIKTTAVKLRGLDSSAKYRVTSLNDRPGRDRILMGEILMKGISVSLPEKWLSEGDGVAGKEFADQLSYGSDISVAQASAVVKLLEMERGSTLSNGSSGCSQNGFVSARRMRSL